MALGQLALDLLERPAKPGQRIFRDAYAAIGNGNANPFARRPGANGDAAPFGGELHCIGEEIQHDLLQEPVIGHDADAPDNSSGQRKPLVIRARRNHAHCVVEEGLQLDLLRIEAYAPGLDLRHVKDVVDDLQQILPALMDVAAVLAIFLGPERAEHPRFS